MQTACQTQIEQQNYRERNLKIGISTDFASGQLGFRESSARKKLQSTLQASESCRGWRKFAGLHAMKVSRFL
jgi:hypothetical protein